jgi:AbrB family looped-hinge helix DNA binding protein
MRIGDRGQVTIPQALREKYGLLANTEVEFEEDSAGLRLIPRSNKRVEKINQLYGSQSFPKSTDELMALLRE